MIQPILKKQIIMAMFAISSLFAGNIQAESPTTVQQAGGVASESAEVTQVGHQESCSTHSDACIHCGCQHSVCDQNGFCERCRRVGRVGRLRDNCRAGLFGRHRCECEACRRGLFGGLGNGGLGNGGFGNRFLPNGCGGKGCPPFGVYQMVYPVNPPHCDVRDGQVHAAQGFGVPMAVPLAPVVRHQYNYSWGVPASRLTPVSNHNPLGAYPLAGYANTPYMSGYPGAYEGSYGVPHNHAPGEYCPHCQQGAAAQE